MNDRIAELVHKLSIQVECDRAVEQAQYIAVGEGPFVGELGYTMSPEGIPRIYEVSLVSVAGASRLLDYGHRLDMAYRSLWAVRVPHWHRSLAQRVRAARKRSRQ